MYSSLKMLLFLLIVIVNSHHGLGFRYRNDSSVDQLPNFAMKVQEPIGLMTTSTGFPVPFQDTQSINRRLLFNDFLVESLIHLSAERIPERVVHAKGTGAFGYFKVTHDLSDVCKAKLFSEKGKKTPLAARFSSVIQRPGGSDVTRETRGFAVKFYTEEGNYDFVAINVEMFQMKDPIIFPTFVHSFHKNPTSMVVDANSRWDFLTQRPESLIMYMRVFGDRGIPDGYRYMPGFTVHTFELLNDFGKRTYARFHLLPDLGIRNLTTAQANQITDLDYAVRDLYNAIAEGNYPTWTLSVQLIPEDDIRLSKFDIFDTSKYWPLRDYPLRPIGTLVLNKNPENQFAEIEQLAFNPGNLVPGIRGVDSLFEGRVLAYRTANMHRLGSNFNKIRVNCPFETVPKTYLRDGQPPTKDNERDSPNYYPNSFNGPLPYVNNEPPRITVDTDPRPNNFDQSSDLYEEMSEGEKCRLIENIVDGVGEAEEFLQERAVKWYKLINEDLGHRIESSLKLRKSGVTEYKQCETEIQ